MKQFWVTLLWPMNFENMKRDRGQIQMYVSDSNHRILGKIGLKDQRQTIGEFLFNLLYYYTFVSSYLVKTANNLTS